MPSVGANLITYLKTKSAVTSKVGTGDNARIFLEFARQGVALPYVVIQTFEGTSAEHLGGISGVAMNRVQIDAYAATESAAYELAEAIRLAPLQMYRGTFGSAWANGIRSDGSYETGYSVASQGANDQKFWFSRDYFVHYQEATSA